MRGYIKDLGLTYNFTFDKGKFFLTGAQKKDLTFVLLWVLILQEEYTPRV
jgi:hypothetical protein